MERGIIELKDYAEDINFIKNRTKKEAVAGFFLLLFYDVLCIIIAGLNVNLYVAAFILFCKGLILLIFGYRMISMIHAGLIFFLLFDRKKDKEMALIKKHFRCEKNMFSWDSVEKTWHMKNGLLCVHYKNGDMYCYDIKHKKYFLILPDNEKED